MTDEYCYHLDCSQTIQLDHLSMQIKEARNNMYRLIDLLKGNEDTSKRQKRAFLSFVGKIGRVLFGTLDEEAEEEIKELMEIAGNNTSTAANLLANQTEFIISYFGNTNIKLEYINVVTLMSCILFIYLLFF